MREIFSARTRPSPKLLFGAGVLSLLAACEPTDRQTDPVAAPPAAIAPAAGTESSAVPTPTTVADAEIPAAAAESVTQPAAAAPERAGVVPSSKTEATPPPPAAVVVPAAFARCGGCHSVDRGAPAKMGPNLFGIVGSRAGSQPGYAYSEAMSASNITWTTTSLDEFIAAPREVVSGTKMAAPPVTDPAARAAIVSYLETLN